MSLRRAKPVANSKTKTMPSPSTISVVIISGKEVTVTLHGRARMSPAKKQETPAEQWPPTATPEEQKTHLAKREMAAKEMMSGREAKADPVKRTVRRRREDDSNSEEGRQGAGSCRCGGPERRDFLLGKLTAGWRTRASLSICSGSL